MHESMLVKLMMMTTSSNDSEALIALRKANKLLKEAGVTWQDLLSALSTPRPSAVPRPRPRPEPEWENVVNAGHRRYDNEYEINAMFDALFASHMGEGFAEFVESVNIQWKQRGFLTGPQYEAIKRAVERRSI